MTSSNLTSNPNRVEGSTYAAHETIYSEWQRNMATIIEQVEGNERRRLREMWPDQDKTVAELSRTKQRNVELEGKLATGNQRSKELGEQLEHDRSLVADCLSKARNAVRCREWLTEGRGSYEWNDDRWHDEFRFAADEFLAALEPMEKVAQDWSGCPTAGEEIAKARLDLKRRIAELVADNEKARQQIVEFAETVQKLQKALAFSRRSCAENYDWWKTAESNVYPLKHRIAELEGQNARLRQQLVEKSKQEAGSA